jgi:hypothetical protein
MTTDPRPRDPISHDPQTLRPARPPRPVDGEFSDRRGAGSQNQAVRAEQASRTNPVPVRKPERPADTPVLDDATQRALSRPSGAFATSRTEARPLGPRWDRPDDLRQIGNRWLMPGVALAALAAVAVAILMAGTFRDDPAPPVTTAAPLGASEAWILNNLTAGSRLLTDDVVKQDLTRQAPGRLDVTSYLEVSGPGPSGAPSLVKQLDYVVSTPSLRTASKFASPNISQVLKYSVPVAIFGSGLAQVLIQEVTPLNSTQRSVGRAADIKARQDAGTALIANAQIQPSPSAVTVLRRGALDLRCAAVLERLAAVTEVQLLDLPITGPEVAAHMPSRTVHVRLADPTVLGSLMSSWPDSYRPAAATPLADGTTRLIWAPAVDPVVQASDR